MSCHVMSNAIFEETRKLAGLREPSDVFFNDGNNLISQFKEFGICEVDNEDFLHEVLKNFTCNILGCSKTFDTIFLFEQHYNLNHRYVCAECKKSLSSAHLLDLHVAETHDSFFAAQAERKPMFQCYTHECQLVFQSPQHRKDHCVTDHGYPASFWADKPITSDKKVKNTQKKKKPKKYSREQGDPMDQDIAPKPEKTKILGQACRSRQKIFVNFSKDLAESLPDLN